MLAADPMTRSPLSLPSGASLLAIGGPISGCEVYLPHGRTIFVWRGTDGAEHHYRAVAGDSGLELVWQGAVIPV